MPKGEPSRELPGVLIRTTSLRRLYPRGIGLLFSLQPGHNGTLTVTFSLSFFTVESRSQRYMGLGKVGRFLDDSLQVGLRAFDLPLGQLDGGKLVADAKIAGTHIQGMVQILERPIVILFFFEENAHAQIRFETVGIILKGSLECLLRPILVTGGHECEAVIGVE